MQDGPRPRHPWLSPSTTDHPSRTLTCCQASRPSLTPGLIVHQLGSSWLYDYIRDCVSAMGRLRSLRAGKAMGLSASPWLAVSIPQAWLQRRQMRAALAPAESCIGLHIGPHWSCVFLQMHGVAAWPPLSPRRPQRAGRDMLRMASYTTASQKRSCKIRPRPLWGGRLTKEA